MAIVAGIVYASQGSFNDTHEEQQQETWRVYGATNTIDAKTATGPGGTVPQMYDVHPENDAIFVRQVEVMPLNPGKTGDYDIVITYGFPTGNIPVNESSAEWDTSIINVHRDTSMNGKTVGSVKFVGDLFAGDQNPGEETGADDVGASLGYTHQEVVQEITYTSKIKPMLFTLPLTHISLGGTVNESSIQIKHVNYPPQSLVYWGTQVIALPFLQAREIHRFSSGYIKLPGDMSLRTEFGADWDTSTHGRGHSLLFGHYTRYYQLLSGGTKPKFTRQPWDIIMFQARNLGEHRDLDAEFTPGGP